MRRFEDEMLVGGCPMFVTRFSRLNVHPSMRS